MYSCNYVLSCIYLSGEQTIFRVQNRSPFELWNVKVPVYGEGKVQILLFPCKHDQFLEKKEVIDSIVD